MKRHELDVFSLVTGLVFGSVAVVYLVASVTETTVDGRWVFPFALIGLGVAGLVGSVAKARRPSRPGEPFAESRDEPSTWPPEVAQTQPTTWLPEFGDTQRGALPGNTASKELPYHPSGRPGPRNELD